jgi:hypothetical protein
VKHSFVNGEENCVDDTKTIMNTASSTTSISMDARATYVFFIMNIDRYLFDY